MIQVSGFFHVFFESVSDDQIIPATPTGLLPGMSPVISFHQPVNANMRVFLGG
jgi:hypothetical protein